LFFFEKREIMLIVQISDIHCGPMFNKRTFRTATKEINTLAPDIVVITGDLTEDGIQSEIKQAAKELKQLKTKNITYVSGNHDYRATGYLLFKEYFPFNQITEIDNAVIIVLSSARPDRDDGEVGHRQNLWLEDTLTKYKNHTKIVAIHHHIVPVPDTGADPITITDAGDVLRSLTKTKARARTLGKAEMKFTNNMTKIDKFIKVFKQRMKAVTCRQLIA